MVAAVISAISLNALVEIVIYLVVVGLILWCIWWFIAYVGLPEPFNKIARVLVALVALVIVVNLLLGLVGTPVFSLR